MQPKKITNDTLIDELEMSVRLTSCLNYFHREANGWEPHEPEGTLPPAKIGDFRHLSDAQLLRLPNFGRKSLKEWNDIIWQVDNPGMPYSEDEKALRTLARHFRELSRLHRQISEVNIQLATLIGSGRYV